MVVDPGDNVPEIEAVLARHALKVTAIVITHAHIDHIGGAAKLKKTTGAPVYMNPADSLLAGMMDVQAAWLGMRAPETPGIDVAAKEGGRLTVGAAAVQILHTPGHTPGSISLWMPSENMLVAGDTLFRDSIGRTDLPGGDGRLILRSIHDKLMPLPDDAVVVPGHGETTTIGREKRYNFFLRDLA
jgi:glyoxylase-like metal-dependent hydrolase (beta-lactamase superfamily II)